MRRLRSLAWLYVLAGLGVGLVLFVHGSSARADAPPTGYHLYLPVVLRQDSLDTRLRPTDHLGGDAMSLALRGTTLYAGVGPELQLLDVSNPAQFQKRGAVLLDGTAQDIVLSGQYAYVAVDYAGVQVVDVSNLAAPTVVAAMPLPGRAVKLTLAGRALYVADEAAGVQVVDVADPLNPRRTDALNIGDPVLDVAVVGDYLYVAPTYKSNHDHRLRVFNVSTPLYPAAVATLAQTGMGVAAVGPKLLAVAGNDTYLLDVTNPTLPAVLSEGYASYGVRAAGPHQMLVLEYARNDFNDPDGDNGIVGLEDITDPTDPTFIDSPNILYGAFAAAIGNGYVFVSGRAGVTQESGILPLAITPQRLQPLDIVDVTDVAYTEFGKLTRIGGTHAYTLWGSGQETSTLRIFDLSDPARLPVVGSLVLRAPIEDAVLGGNRLYVAGGVRYQPQSDFGVHIVDVANAAAPREIGVYHPGGEAFATALVDGALAVGVEVGAGDAVTDTLRLVDVSNAAAPRELGRYTPPGSFRTLAGAGHTLYTLTDASFQNQVTATLRILDASDPANVHEVGSYALSGESEALTVADGRAYALIGAGPTGSTTSPGLYILDVSNPAAIREVGYYSQYPNGCGCEVRVDGPTIYLVAYMWGGAGSMRRLSILDASAGHRPGYLGGLPSDYPVRGLAVAGGRAYILNFERITTLDVSRPGVPQYVGFWDTPPARGMAAAGRTGYMASEFNGLQTLDLTDPAHPRITGSAPTPNGAYAVSLSGATVCAVEEDGLSLHHPLPDGHLTQAFGYSTGLDYVWTGVCDGDRAYLVQDDTTDIIDISPSGDGGRLGSIPFQGSITVRGAYLYGAGRSKFVIYDVSDPAAPKPLGSLPVTGGTDQGGVDVVGSYAYVADGASGLRIIDVSNPVTPTQVGVVALPGSAYTVAVAGSDAFVVTVPVWLEACACYSRGGLYVVDVSHPTAPKVVGHGAVADIAYSATAANGAVYLSNSSGGLYTFKAPPGAADVARAVVSRPAATSSRQGAVGAATRPPGAARGAAPLDHSRRLPR